MRIPSGESRLYIYGSRPDVLDGRGEHKRLVDFQTATAEPRDEQTRIRAAQTASVLARASGKAYVDPHDRKLTHEDWGHVVLGILAGLADGAIGEANELSRDKVTRMRLRLRDALGIKSKSQCGTMATGRGGGGYRR